MRTFLLIGPAALSFAAIPVAATAQQAAASADVTIAVPSLTAEQQVAFDTWPADRQAAFTGWTAAQQAYFWTLSHEQRTAYWLLSAEQRRRIDAMTPAQRELAWRSISRQLAGAPTANEANAAVPPKTETTVATRITADGQPQKVITTTSSNLVLPPLSALDKEYPVCRGAIQDSCQNPGEGGAPGRSRVLGYWPGDPAGEREEKGG